MVDLIDNQNMKIVRIFLGIPAKSPKMVHEPDDSEALSAGDLASTLDEVFVSVTGMELHDTPASVSARFVFTGKRGRDTRDNERLPGARWSI